ncbi:MAG TPA: GNAT family protein [Gryllotalpicola sp.]
MLVEVEPAVPASRGFAIVVDGLALGDVVLSEIEPVQGTAWVEYRLAAAGSGTGILARALATVAEWAFAELGLFRLELSHRVDLPAVCRVASRAGFLAEGVERQKFAVSTGRVDAETHARLRTDPRPALSLLGLQAL